MSFNWFNRSYNEAAEEEKAESTTAETDGVAASPEVDDIVDADPQPAIAEDRLAFAKALYQNIQQQQATTPTSPTATAPPTTSSIPETTSSLATTTVEETPATVESVPATPSEVTAETDSEPAVTPSTPENATVTPEAELGTEIAAEPESDTSETEVLPSSTVATPLSTTATATEETPSPVDTAPSTVASGPAWMQATAERQARLEKLQETAIAEPEPELEPEAASTTKSAPDLESLLPDFDFDEAFLWSAEVLAAQGRKATDISVEEITWLNRLRQGLDKTRRSLVNRLKAIVGQGPLNEEAVFEIEALLLQADVGVEATDAIVEALQSRLREETLPPEQAIAYLKTILRDMLDKPLRESHNLTFVPTKDTLNIWLLTGVNGAGKTTTIGKLAHIAKKSDYNCLIGAADTFRAAAVEQVKAWGARSNVEVIANPGQV
ncbi:MAG: signal recognition particle receptor subunit alpha [Cyanobacteria bacterium P01_H01_bin.58]